MSWFSKPKEEEPPPEETILRCSFCSKSQQEVRKLIAGPTVYICNECISLCSDIISEEEARQALEDEPPWPPSAGELMQRLDQAVVGHQVAKRVLTASARMAMIANANTDGAPLAPRVLLVGPAGCGKSALAGAFARLSGLPHTMIDLSRLTTTGYVGEDLENVLAELVERSGESVEAAQRGLLVLDGLQNNLRRDAGPELTRDVTGDGVQRGLGRLLSGAQMRYQGSGPYHPGHKAQAFDPTRLTVVMTHQMDEVPRTDQAIRQKLLADGVLPEVLSRVSMIVPMAPLGMDEQRRVLAAHLLPQCAHLVEAIDGNLRLEADALDMLALRAEQASDGAWSLKRDLAQIMTVVFADARPERRWDIDQHDLQSLLDA